MSTEPNNSSSVLLEIGTEEIPSRFLPTAINDLRAIAEKTFSEYRIDHADIKVFATPRRLAVIVSNVNSRQKDNVREIFGPSKKAAFDDNGNPTRAAAGFASSLNISVTDLQIKQKGKGDYVVAVVEEKGVDTVSVLPELLKKIILSLHFPKAMRWGNGSMTFVRPIAWLLAVAGAETIELDIDGLRSGNQTRGHRFLSPASYKIRDIAGYKQFLETNFVILDQNKRRDMIMKSMTQLVQGTETEVVIDEGLIETVNYLVEYPVPVLCSFDMEYLKLPKELLVTVMRDHQKYFAVQDRSGNLANSFIVISNTKADNADIVRTGAQRVIKARFDDAKFYYSEDASKTLASRMESLGDVTFHDQLGSVLEKTERIASIAGFLAEKITPDIKETVIRAARLSKTDLITGVVREFPELQGIMGKYYAGRDAEPQEVAIALEEQYMPKSFGDKLPASDAGALVSLADKIDNIASFFSIGLIPTGSEDPFALRRQAMGIISILLDKGYDLSLKEAFEHALSTLKNIRSHETVMDNIMSFMAQRTEFILSSAGHSQEIIKSLLQLSFGSPLKTITAKMEALVSSQKEAAFPDFILAVKRVNNIVPKTELPPIQPSLFMQEEEKELYSALTSLKTMLAPLLEQGDYGTALGQIITGLTAPVNSFFDKVLVMDKQEEVKTNRLSMLKDIWETVSHIADFSKFQS